MHQLDIFKFVLKQKEGHVVLRVGSGRTNPNEDFRVLLCGKSVCGRGVIIGCVFGLFRMSLFYHFVPDVAGWCYLTQVVTGWTLSEEWWWWFDIVYGHVCIFLALVLLQLQLLGQLFLGCRLIMLYPILLGDSASGARITAIIECWWGFCLVLCFGDVLLVGKILTLCMHVSQKSTCSTCCWLGSVCIVLLLEYSRGALGSEVAGLGAVGA